MERKYFCTFEVTRFFNKRSIWESAFNAPSLTAAEHHGKGNHEEGKKHSTAAHEHSGKAHEVSKAAHQKSQQQK
jgi:hypothetical protein